VVGSCESGNEPSGFIKCREFLDWLGFQIPPGGGGGGLY
jgi:hypothetical protein